jgi:hypothetical protein
MPMTVYLAVITILGILATMSLSVIAVKSYQLFYELKPNQKKVASIIISPNVKTTLTSNSARLNGSDEILEVVKAILLFKENESLKGVGSSISVILRRFEVKIDKNLRLLSLFPVLACAVAFSATAKELIIALLTNTNLNAQSISFAITYNALAVAIMCFCTIATMLLQHRRNLLTHDINMAALKVFTAFDDKKLDKIIQIKI